MLCNNNHRVDLLGGNDYGNGLSPSRFTTSFLPLVISSNRQMIFYHAKSNWPALTIIDHTEHDFTFSLQYYLPFKLPDTRYF